MFRLRATGQSASEGLCACCTDRRIEQVPGAGERQAQEAAPGACGPCMVAQPASSSCLAWQSVIRKFGARCDHPVQLVCGSGSLLVAACVGSEGHGSQGLLYDTGARLVSSSGFLGDDTANTERGHASSDSRVHDRLPAGSMLSRYQRQRPCS